MWSHRKLWLVWSQKRLITSSRSYVKQLAVVLIPHLMYRESLVAVAMMTMDSKRLSKHKEEQRKKPNNKRRKKDKCKMKRRKRWKRKRSKKSCWRNSKKKRRIERDKKQKHKDRNNLKSKRKQPRVPKNKQRRDQQLSKKLITEMMITINKKRNFNNHKCRKGDSMMMMASMVPS